MPTQPSSEANGTSTLPWKSARSPGVTGNHSGPLSSTGVGGRSAWGSAGAVHVPVQLPALWRSIAGSSGVKVEARYGVRGRVMASSQPSARATVACPRA